MKEFKIGYGIGQSFAEVINRIMNPPPPTKQDLEFGRILIEAQKALIISRQAERERLTKALAEIRALTLKA